MSAELAPCPFCGGKAAVHRCEHAFHDAKVRCAECCAEGPIFDVDDGKANEAGRNEAEAIAAWNRRTPPAPMEAVAWRDALKAADDLVVTGTIYEDEALLADAETVKKFIAAHPPHPAPIKPSADTGELRERVAKLIDEKGRLDLTAGFPPFGFIDNPRELADAILNLIQSEREGSPIGQNDQPGLAFSDAGEP